MLVMIFLTPYIVAHIGIERFGILSIAGVISVYFGMFDIGLSTSFVKYIAEYHAKNEKDNINRLVNTGLVFYIVFTAVMCLLAVFFIEPLISLLKIPTDLHDEVAFVFFMSIFLFGASNAAGVFISVQSGLQRMDITNKVVILVSFLNIGGTIFFLEKGYGLPGLVINNTIIFAVTSVIACAVAFRIMPGLRFSLFMCSKEMFRKLFDFGYKMQVVKVAEIILFQTDRLIIAGFLNMSLVGFYQLGTTIIQQARQLPMLLVSAVLPTASEIDAKQDHTKMMDLYMKGSKYLVLASVPFMLFIAASAEVIMRIWMGEGYGMSAAIIQVLALGYLVNLLAGVGVMVSMAKGKLDFQVKAAAITALLNVFLCLGMLKIMGFMGIAVATTIALVVGPIYFFIKLHVHLKVPLVPFFKKVMLKPFIGAAVPALVIWMLDAAFMPRLAVNKPVMWVVFLTEAAIFAVVYIAAMIKSGYIDKYDRDLLGRYLPFGKGTEKAGGTC